MGKEKAGSLRNVYLERYAIQKSYIAALPHEQLSLIVTIPCYDEDELITAFQSIKNCTLPDNVAVEVIVVINEPEDAEDEISKINQKAYEEALNWSLVNSSDKLQFHIIFEKLKPKHAGVGLARKIAMDEAVRRFEKINNPRGIILCYDADCTCDPDYLKAVYEYFKQTDCVGASIYYEHPTSGQLDDRIYEGIIRYELYLRYYANALKHIGYPFSHQTIGSSMAVRNDIYQKVGGMNRRKAGEDFYFLHKVMPMGIFGEITTTRVIPSPRPSHRVPFGTGRAINKYLENGYLNTYDLRIFEELRIFLNDIPAFFKNGLPRQFNYSEAVNTYLDQVNASEHITAIINRSDRPETYQKHFYSWLDGLQVLKYVHYARDHFYPPVPLESEVSKLALKLYNESWDGTAEAQLLQMREKDKLLG